MANFGATHGFAQADARYNFDSTTAAVGVVSDSDQQADTPVARLKCGTSAAHFNKGACQIPLPVDAGDISCLKWHPLRHMLAAGTWGGQVLLYSVTDVFTRGEQAFTGQGGAFSTADIRATLLHSVPVGVPILSIAWRPCSAGDDLQDVLAVSGASDTVALVFAKEGVLVPLTTLHKADGTPVDGGVFGVGWMHFEAAALAEAGAIRAANSDVLSGEELCTPLISATYNTTLHCTSGVSGKLLREIREVLAKQPGDMASAEALINSHGVETILAQSDDFSKYTCLDVVGPLAYLGTAAGLPPPGTTTFPSCKIKVFAPTAEKKLKILAKLDTSLKICINQVVANPRRWGSVTSFGAESRTNVTHVGNCSRQKFTYKSHRAGGPRTEENSTAFLPTALCWMQPAASDYLARLYYRRPHHEGMQHAALELDDPPTFSEDLAAAARPAMDMVKDICDESVTSVEVSPDDAASAGTVTGAARLEYLPPTPGVPSPYYEYLLSRSSRYMTDAKRRETLLSGALCVSAANNGSVLFWDVDKRMRNLVSELYIKQGSVEKLACATHLACDSTGSLLAIASGPSWAEGDPSRPGQAAKSAHTEVLADASAPSHLVVFPICDMMAQR